MNVFVYTYIHIFVYTYKCETFFPAYAPFTTSTRFDPDRTASRATTTIGFRWAWSDKDTPPADRMKAQDVLPSLQEQMIKTEEKYTLVNRTDDKDRGEIHAGKPIAMQEALEEESTKDTPSFGSENLEEIHRAGTEAGLLGIYNFPGAVYATDGSNDKGFMGAGYFKLDENRERCCQLGRGEEGNSSNRAELGAACLALEDAKRKRDRKPIILLSDSACFLSSSQKWIGEGKPPSMHGNPDADIMGDIVQLLRDRIEQGLLTIFIKIKAYHGDPLNELADRWADEGRQSENIRWSLPTNRPIFYWTDNGTTHRSPMNPTVKT